MRPVGSGRGLQARPAPAGDVLARAVRRRGGLRADVARGRSVWGRARRWSSRRRRSRVGSARPVSDRRAGPARCGGDRRCGAGREGRIHLRARGDPPRARPGAAAPAASIASRLSRFQTCCSAARSRSGPFDRGRLGAPREGPRPSRLGAARPGHAVPSGPRASLPGAARPAR